MVSLINTDNSFFYLIIKSLQERPFNEKISDMIKIRE